MELHGTTTIWLSCDNYCSNDPNDLSLSLSTNLMLILNRNHNHNHKPHPKSISLATRFCKVSPIPIMGLSINDCEA